MDLIVRLGATTPALKGRCAAQRFCRQHSGKRLSLLIDGDPLANTVFAFISAIAKSL